MDHFFYLVSDQVFLITHALGARYLNNDIQSSIPLW